MSDTRDLKELLDRLKGEVRSAPLPPERAEEYAAPARRRQTAAPEAGREQPQRPYKFPEYRPEAREHSNPAWEENKEAMLFGMLAALIAALGGVLAGLDYLVQVGAAVFALFSLAMVAALLRSCLFLRRRPAEQNDLAERVDALSRRVELLSSRAAAAGPARRAEGAAPDRGLEQKVEELRVLVKSLSRAVEGPDK